MVRKGSRVQVPIVAPFREFFQNDLRNTIHLLVHWAERNSRGVAQFSGQIIDFLINTPNNEIDVNKSKEHLQRLINL